ncbi:MAG: hypothetical protein AB1847_01240 [bacterium]
MINGLKCKAKSGGEGAKLWPARIYRAVKKGVKKIADSTSQN